MKRYFIENEDGSTEEFPFEEPEKTTTPSEDATALVLMWGRDAVHGLSDDELEEQADLILGNCDIDHMEAVTSYLAAALSNFIIETGRDQGLSPEEALQKWAMLAYMNKAR